MGWLGFVLSHPSDKNKDVARMGHPNFVVVEMDTLRYEVSHAILWRVGMGRGFAALINFQKIGGRFIWPG